MSNTNPYEAKLLAGKGAWDVAYDTETVGVEVVGDPEEVSEPEEVKVDPVEDKAYWEEKRWQAERDDELTGKK